MAYRSARTSDTFELPMPSRDDTDLGPDNRVDARLIRWPTAELGVDPSFVGGFNRRGARLAGPIAR
jgi:hypothetical protein